VKSGKLFVPSVESNRIESERETVPGSSISSALSCDSYCFRWSYQPVFDGATELGCGALSRVINPWYVQARAAIVFPANLRLFCFLRTVDMIQLRFWGRSYQQLSLWLPQMRLHLGLAHVFLFSLNLVVRRFSARSVTEQASSLLSVPRMQRSLSGVSLQFSGPRCSLFIYIHNS
jgi:hypothetical protein